jgi:WD40 repeat protein
MTTERDFDRRLGSWFEQVSTATAPEGLLARSLERVGATHQRSGWLVPDGWRSRRAGTPRSSTRARTDRRWMVAAAAVVGVLAFGGAFYLNGPRQPTNGGPSPTPSASVEETAEATPEATAKVASWTATGSMHSSVTGTATLLPNGKVLVASATSYGTNQDTTAELYDPATGSWTATGHMLIPEGGGTATLLRDGRVLAVGGRDGGAAAELYDPATGSWSLTGSMTTGRSGFSATLLQDGRVLVAGGTWEAPPGNDGALASAEVYDPATGTWARTGSMIKARFLQTATLLPDGKVLVAGGLGTNRLGQDPPPLASAELYDPGTGTWTATGKMTTVRVDHTATLLRDGRVLVTGGNGASAELYDPTSATWARTGSRVTAAAVRFTATLLPDGRVLLAGGWNLQLDAEQNPIAVASAELFDPGSGTWTATVSMTIPRMGHMATLLPDGRVLVAGYAVGSPRASAELYDPGTGQ